MEAIYYIYHIYKQENENEYDKGYIGITNNPQRRKSAHFRLLNDNKHYNDHLQNAYNKYGTLKFKIICITNYEHACYMENKLRPEKRIGLNISIGGMSTCVNHKQTKECKDKHSQAAIKWMSNKIKKDEAMLKRQKTLRDNPNIKIDSLQKREKTVKIKQSQGWKYKKPSPFIYIIDGKFYEYAEDAYKEHKISKTTLHQRCEGWFRGNRIVDNIKVRVKIYYKDCPEIKDPFENWDRIEK